MSETPSPANTAPPDDTRSEAAASDRSWVPERYRPARRWPRVSVGRALLLVVTGVCIYLLLPRITEVVEAWKRLDEVDLRWLPLILGAQLASFACIWHMQKLALPSATWFSIITTHVAGNAFNRITPLGGVTGAALQARLLYDSGISPAASSSAMATQSILGSVALGALPLCALPLLAVTGTAAPDELIAGAWIGAVVFVMLAAIFVILLWTQRPMAWIGNTIDAVGSRIRGRPRSGLGDRLVRERNAMRTILGSRWPEAIADSIGRWIFEYVVLLAILIAIGASPNPVLVLFAMTIGALLSLVPLTPGGIGFVELGLSGTLIAAGIAPNEALLATLAFRLVSFWLPLPFGLVAVWVFRRRHPRRSTIESPAA
jgi:uncharacterized protein (TIRG00374 family)